MPPKQWKQTRHAARIERINEALARRDLDTLRALATSGVGLVNNGLRRLAWPVLLGFAEKQFTRTEKPAMVHRDAHQVQLDVNRSQNYCSSVTRRSVWREKRRQLSEVALHTLQEDASLHYYQGFHDVCAVLIHVLGDAAAKEAAVMLAHCHLRDAMSATLDPVMRQLDLLYSLVGVRDRALADFLIASDTPPYFALSWVLAWFSHDVPDPARAARLFDLFLCSNPIMPLYVAACVVLAQRDALLAGECEFTKVHHRLIKLQSELITDELLQSAVKLYQECPVLKLQSVAGQELDPTSAPLRFVADLQSEHVLQTSTKDRRIGISSLQQRLLISAAAAGVVLLSAAAARFYPVVIQQLYG
ncbi:rab-GTPase-TBC domain-containing protein [Thamnocephalis sphaerospora]|uniref:Rab-GTPase-TBC domain-containing protein n=1 Tax=Thamnocephalis sphaerospora TaxID=78915 RepID=A0A4V1IX94_9FUNG|nr:rab-GTPase-TBC domain-containing protein [Thamnocephalis sphaerospora]|eukprot:RKP10269.1 rab-GTPase-TBC domain-containing protein [Thamnocephalis sphaerospora]